MNLFEPIVKETKLHPLVKKIIWDKTYIPTQKIINEWSTGLTNRSRESKKFVKEFQTTFNSSFWEIYLNKAFRELGLSIDYSKNSPDFHLTNDDGVIVNVEAVTSNNPRNLDENYYEDSSRKDEISLPEKELFDKYTLKLAGKIKDKHQLFVGCDNKKHPYKELEHVKGNPFVLAIAPFDNHLAYSQNNTAINRVLYGIEPPEPYGHVESVEYITTNSGSRVNLGIFTNRHYKDISAVIFSTTGMFGKAVHQSGVCSKIRATKYRQMSIESFIANEGKDKIGMSMKELPGDNFVHSIRFYSNDMVCGSDMYFYDTKMHKESHLDGLHIYFNPYAKVPLPKSFFSSYEITSNDYDRIYRNMIAKHNDNSLVSRQTYTKLG